MKTTLFGLDIGTTSLKVALVRKQGETYMLDAVAVAPTTKKGVISESIADQQALAAQIKQMHSNSGIKIIDASISIPEIQVYTKVIEMPSLSEQELAAALKFQMEQYIPLPLDQVRTDWQILGQTEEEGKKGMNVMIVAAPISLLEKYDKILSLAGINVETIETEIISVHRALLPLIASTQTNIIVHIGATATNVAIVKDSAINIVFTIGLGGFAITRAISLDLGIDSVQAENYKKAYGLSQEAFEGKVGKSLHPILDSIIGDIKKSLLSFKEKNNNEDVKQIILSGGTALLPGIDAYIANILGIQVVLGNCWDAYNIQNVPPEIKAEAPSYNVVIGLALRNLI